MIYNYLFKKGRIGSLTLKNRIVMPPMGTSLASAEGEITDNMIRYYEERAKGGTGLIIVEVTSIDYEFGRAIPSQPRVDDHRFIPGMNRLASAVHKYGAKIFMQLHHAGRQTNSLLTDGKEIVAPSAVTCEMIGEEPRALTTNEVKELVEKYIMGAVRCKQAGIDGVELHAAHGYLIGQFLSPYTNVRTDEYGGNFANRFRFLKEIIVGIRQKCGNDYPLTVRLSVDEFVEGGIDLTLGKRICCELENLGIDALHVTGANYDSMDKVIEPPSYPQGWRVYLAEEIKKSVHIPVITVGVIREPEYAELILAEGKADFVAVGRGLIADPDWAIKAEEGREKEINKCISCLYCLDTMLNNWHVHCAVNARMGRELEFDKFVPITEYRHVVVVGGGPAGMEAARVLAEKGYKVTLFEKKNKLGGQLNLAIKPLRKEKIQWLIDYLRNEMDRLNIDVQLNTEATVEMIKSMDPFAVFLATGAKNFIQPTMKGHDLVNVFGYEAVLQERRSFVNNKIAVIGAGMTGCETAELLAAKGNEVLLIEITATIGTNASPSLRADLLKYLKKTSIECMANHQLMEIRPNSIVVEQTVTRERKEIEIDHVVMAMETKSYNPLEEPLKEHMDNVFVIGDADKPDVIAKAIRDGFEKAFVIESLTKSFAKGLAMNP